MLLLNAAGLNVDHQAKNGATALSIATRIVDKSKHVEKHTRVVDAIRFHLSKKCGASLSSPSQYFGSSR